MICLLWLQEEVVLEAKVQGEVEAEEYLKTTLRNVNLNAPRRKKVIKITPRGKPCSSEEVEALMDAVDRAAKAAQTVSYSEQNEKEKLRVREMQQLP